MSRLLATATLATAVRALAFDGKPARATNAVVPDATFNLAEITEAPKIRELMRRAEGEQTILFGPDNTCGYVSGRAGAPITCNTAYTCAFIYDDSYGRGGCYSDNDYGIRDTCLDYQQVYSTSLCDNGCLQDTFTLKCTETTAPYCGTLTWFSGIVDYLCADRPVSTPQQLLTTYIGESDGRSFQTLTYTSTESGSDGSSIFNTVTGDDSFTIPSSSSRAASSTGFSGGNGGNSGSSGSNGGSDNSNSNGGDEPVTKSSSTPIGPIVGGVVGGVGGLALIGLGIFFIIRHNNKKKKNNNGPLNPGQPMQQTPVPGGMGPPPGAPGYPPQAYAQQPYQQQPVSPQGFYPQQEQKPAGFVTLSPTGVPDRHDSTSPVSQFSEARHSVQPQSPTSTLNTNWGPQPGQQAPPNVAVAVPATVHEAGGNVVGQRDYNSNHHGQFHEMA
ncbi:hypothetical protein GQX73_g7620 [Xylaria multiplex]|uniref:Uncharacterized protein n=1 Tax=Xylaria multiplex TaxID=323545 RepID=A0A7C8IKG8_9PEZI|nr:hypothetical protein GQX73_g7620 [Xylaria multiplex]